MDYFKAFESIKKVLEKSEVPAKDEHIAIQICMTDETSGGIFYIEQKDRQWFIMPYDYRDNDIEVIASYKDIKAIAEGKLNAKKAFDDGKISITRNPDMLFELTDLIKAPEKKAKPKSSANLGATKKGTAKKSGKASVSKQKKSMEALKMSDTKKEDTIQKVVEKETKPVKKATKPAKVSK